MGWYLLTIFCAGLGVFLIGLAVGMKLQQHLDAKKDSLHPMDWWEIEGWR